ncbi:protein-export chaperone SecB [Sphingomicrobium clamense]|nr:protein-export chaperone SecB [Sphingomicrobium sp. B8]
MADETPTPPQPEGAPQDDAPAMPQFSVLAQYMKDLSVENPNAPKVFQFKTQPQVQLQYELEVTPQAEDVFEVALKIQAGVKSDEGQHFLIDLTYAGLFGVRGFPQDQVQPLLMIEAPRMIFPFARQTIMNASQDCGAPPLMLEPIDFAAQYIANMRKAAEANGAATAPAGEAPADAPTDEAKA